MPMYTIEQLNEHRRKPTNLIAIEYCGKKMRPDGKGADNLINCRCICGNFVIVTVNSFRMNGGMSCGCLTVFGNAISTQDKSQKTKRSSVLYSRWIDIRRRCYNPNHATYKTYGAKGVTMCEEWKSDFQAFAKWSLENGFAPELHIDKDIKGDGKMYSPENCTWVTPYVNSTVKALRYSVNGEMLTLTEISKKFNINRHTLRDRLALPNMTIEKALVKGRIHWAYHSDWYNNVAVPVT